MNLSMGMILLCAGGAGLVVFTVLGIISWVLLRKKGKKLLSSIQQEYE